MNKELHKSNQIFILYQLFMKIVVLFAALLLILGRVLGQSKNDAKIGFTRSFKDFLLLEIQTIFGVHASP